MHVWRKGRKFLTLIQHKQYRLQKDIFNVQKVLDKIDMDIAALMDDLARKKQSIKKLVPAGLISRNEIYQGIRKQGVLLSQQQLILHKISELEDQRLRQRELLDEYHLAMGFLNKKHYKIEKVVKISRQNYLSGKEKKIETDIQEVAYCAGKNE